MPGEATPTIGAPPGLAAVPRYQHAPGPVRLAGDILWLGTSAFVFAVIVGIVYWPLSAELSSRILAGATWGSSTAGVAPGAGESYATLPPVYSANRIAVSGASLTTTDEVGEGSSGVLSTTSIAAPTALREVKLSLLELQCRTGAEPELSRVTVGSP